MSGTVKKYPAGHGQHPNSRAAWARIKKMARHECAPNANSTTAIRKNLASHALRRKAPPLGDMKSDKP